MERRDIPIVNFDEDEFGAHDHVNALCKFIKQGDTPITIALQGEWGSGKSSFMKMMESCLCSEELPDAERYDSIWVNTWELFLETDHDVAVKKLLLSLVMQLEEHFEKKKKGARADKRREIMKEYLKNISGFALESFHMKNDYSDKILDLVFAEKRTTKSVKKVISELDEFITEEVNEKNNGVTDNAFIVFVDDLDRLEPKLAVTLLEALKNLFELQKCVFVIAIDYDVVARGVSLKYGGERLGNRSLEKDFFDKLIQVPYVIPMERYDISNMIMERLREMQFFNQKYEYNKYREMLVNIASVSTNKNPRAIKRLLNMLQLMLAMDKEQEERTSAFRIMEFLLMALQLSFPEIYTMIAHNYNLDLWKRSFYIGGGKEKITEEIRERYQLDEDWKEVIYLAMEENEVISHNYHRVARLLEIYEDVLNRCQRKGENVEEALGIINVICTGGITKVKVQYDGEAYDKSSQTQKRQGNHLIEMLDFDKYTDVLDIGCGSGQTTIQMWSQNRSMRVTAVDISESQIKKAKENYKGMVSAEEQAACSGYIHFNIMDAMELDESDKYDLIFSNAVMHWIEEPKQVYHKMRQALVPGGAIAVHQGGNGTYAGLHDVVKEAIKKLGFQKKFKGWIFPAYYPDKDEVEEFLSEVAGYVNVRVESVFSDEKNNDTLVENFANASLIYYQQAGLTDEEYAALRKCYFEICAQREVDKSSHRLYIYAERPKEK